jgi:chromosomal replication initiation ATPase DnaA
MIQLIRKINLYSGITFEQIVSKSRKKDICFARAIFCHEMRFKLGYNTYQIAEIINQTHKNVCYITNKAYYNYQKYSEFLSILTRISKLCG